MSFPIVLNDGEIFDGLDDGIRGGMFIKTEFNTLFDVRGDNVIIRNINVSHPASDFDRIISVKGKKCHIISCIFSEFDVSGPIVVLERKERLDIPDELVVRDCLFYNGRDMEKNGNEGIRLGWSGSSLTGVGRNIIYNNRFENYHREIEAISVKCNENLLVNNEVIGSQTTLTLRHGKNSVVGYNYIDGKLKQNTGGIRVVDDGHIIIGNVIKSCNGDGLRAGISLMCGVTNSPLNRYLRVEKCCIYNNVIVRCYSALSLGMEKKEAKLKPKNVIVEGNVFDSNQKIESMHKDSIGAIHFSDIAKNNRIDTNGKLKLQYDDKMVKFELKEYDEMKEEMMNYQVESPTPTPEPVVPPPTFNERDFVAKLAKRLKIIDKEYKLKKIADKMESNLAEFRTLMGEFRDITKP